VLSQGEPRDAAVNFETCRIFTTASCGYSLSQRGFFEYISDAVQNAEITPITLTQNHGDSRKSRHTGSCAYDPTSIPP